MKTPRTGEPLGFNFDPPRTVKAGDVCGHLEVIEELPKRQGGARRWRCRVDGQPCGRLVVKETGALTKATKFRACPSCTEVYMKGVRDRWNRGGSF